MEIVELTIILKENNMFTPRYVYLVHWAKTINSITVKKVSEGLNISERAAKLHIERLEGLGLIETGKIEKTKREKLSQMTKPDIDAALSVRFTYFVWDKLSKAHPDNIEIRKAFLDIWERECRLLIEERQKKIKEITDTFLFAIEDDFWKAVILSAGNFRRKYDKIREKMTVKEDKKPQFTTSKTYLSD